MNRLRHSLIALTAGVVALLVTFFVATATLAFSPPHQVGHHVAISPEMPCEPEATLCAPDCAVLCEALTLQPPLINQPLNPRTTPYSVCPTGLRSPSLEAEDPPPR